MRGTPELSRNLLWTPVGTRRISTFILLPCDPSQRVEARVKRSLERLYALQNRPFRSRVPEHGELAPATF